MTRLASIIIIVTCVACGSEHGDPIETVEDFRRAIADVSCRAHYRCDETALPDDFDECVENVATAMNRWTCAAGDSLHVDNAEACLAMGREQNCSGVGRFVQQGSNDVPSLACTMLCVDADGNAYN